MKTLIALFLFCFSAQAFALEVEGVKLDEKVQMEKAALQLNGAGLRSIFFIKLYVAALYLENKKTTADAILADKGAKRIELHVVAGEASSDRLMHGYRNGIEKNHNEAQLDKLKERMAELEKLFGNIKTITRGDVIAFDWVPGVATRVSLDGRELGRIEGEDFFLALLSIWIGENPVMDRLKKDLLGG